MSRNITTLAVVAVLIASTNLFAGFYVPETNFSSQTHMNGFDGYLNGNNSDAWYHMPDPGDPGEGHWHEAYSSGNYYFQIKQGFMGKNMIPFSINQEIYRWDDSGDYGINATFRLLFVDDIWADFQKVPSVGSGFNAFGINYNMHSNMGHEEIWKEDTEIITSNIEGNFNYYFENSTLNYGDDYIDQFSHWADKDTIIDGLEINLYFNLTIEEKFKEAFFASVPVTAVPEPATMALLSSGILGVLLKRRRA